MNRSSSGIRRVGAALLPALLVCSCAHALTVIGVGAPPCEYAKIQDAFDAAYTAISNSSDPVEVRITRSPAGIWHDQTDGLTVLAGAKVTVTGGYADCTQTVPDTTKTGVYGMSGFSTSALGPVLKFGIFPGGILYVRLLDIRGGTAELDSPWKVGGGIHLYAGGTLVIADTLVTENSAETGGGIGAEGDTPNAELVIGDNVIISSNQANSGGGVSVDGMHLKMLGSGSTLAFNHADSGAGGGLYLTNHACLGSEAEIGAGVGGLGPLYGNTANRGGGVAAIANDTCHSTVILDLVQIASSIQGNFAAIEGGGIYAAQGVPAYPEQTDPLVFLNLVSLTVANNASPSGAAVKAIAARVSATYVNVTGNSSEDASATPLNGGIFELIGQPQMFSVDVARFQGNAGGPVLLFDSIDARPATIDTSLIVDNVVRGSVVQSHGSIPVTVSDTTIAHNQISGTHVLDFSSDKLIARSIIDQPGTTSLHSSGGATQVQYVVTSEQPSLGVGVPLVFEGSPRFVDVEHGDYTLQASSPAVDFAPADPFPQIDVALNARDQDLPLKQNVFGPHDLGAFERQALQPLVLNGDFDSDQSLLRWTYFAGSWDDTSNAAGAFGSGSWKYSASSTNGGRNIVAQQCVFLPGPGMYAISGWGHTSGFTVDTRDYARLGWEYRGDGLEDCTSGAPTASGEFTLGHSAGWTHATIPVAINALVWSRTSSIRLYLIAAAGTITTERTINAWFDGITIDADQIFKNNFD